jgi:hypothetical protein
VNVAKRAQRLQRLALGIIAPGGASLDYQTASHHSKTSAGLSKAVIQIATEGPSVAF